MDLSAVRAVKVLKPRILLCVCVCVCVCVLVCVSVTVCVSMMEREREIDVCAQYVNTLHWRCDFNEI